MKEWSQSLERVRDSLLKAWQLKDLLRSGWVRAGVEQPESVAAHSWGVAFLVMTLAPKSLDKSRALQIALVHDLAEVVVGDIMPCQHIPEAVKHVQESQALSVLTAQLPQGELLQQLFAEYQQALSPESKFVHACDKLDMALQAQLYSGKDPKLDLYEFITSALGALDEPSWRSLASGA